MKWRFRNSLWWTTCSKKKEPSADSAPTLLVLGVSGEIAQNRLQLMIASSRAAFSQNAFPFSTDDSFWAPQHAIARWRAFSRIFSMLKYSRRFTSEKWAFDAGDDQKRPGPAHLCSELSLHTTPSHTSLCATHVNSNHKQSRT